MEVKLTAQDRAQITFRLEVTMTLGQAEAIAGKIERGMNATGYDNTAGQFKCALSDAAAACRATFSGIGKDKD